MPVPEIWSWTYCWVAASCAAVGSTTFSMRLVRALNVCPSVVFTCSDCWSIMREMSNVSSVASAENLPVSRKSLSCSSGSNRTMVIVAAAVGFSAAS